MKKNSNKKASLHTTITNRPKKIIKLLTKETNYSICIPIDIIDSCKNLDQITDTLYQVARCCTIYNIAEIIILKTTNSETTDTENKNVSKEMLIASILQYFVTPPYLIKSVFKKKYLPYFKYAEKLPRLNALPFMRYLNMDNGRYREGLAVRMKHPNIGNSTAGKKKKYDQTKYIQVGKNELLELKTQLVPINVRVTVDMIEKKVVSPQEAYGDFVGLKNTYGYYVRVASRFSDLFLNKNSPNYTQTVWCNSGDFYFDEHSKKYLKIQTKIPQFNGVVVQEEEEEDKEQQDGIPSSHLLVVFGKWTSLMKSFERVKNEFEGCDGVYQFFDGELALPVITPLGNLRIEDATMIALTILSGGNRI
ncbi:uncharacterized protein SCODWIG_03746 [Saccharomycodes ludwigii]|uniref:Uncharacterized protein n=1 Tax=Saccharomycodes ludwigii TaxID=36035 RepID=A0A376BBB8_9ASCO|nr:uncharacterized protein SCODWIG_03746 [Saccharomycodes ludwigii]